MGACSFCILHIIVCWQSTYNTHYVQSRGLAAICGELSPFFRYELHERVIVLYQSGLSWRELLGGGQMAYAGFRHPRSAILPRFTHPLIMSPTPSINIILSRARGWCTRHTSVRGLPLAGLDWETTVIYPIIWSGRRLWLPRFVPTKEKKIAYIMNNRIHTRSYH